MSHYGQTFLIDNLVVRIPCIADTALWSNLPKWPFFNNGRVGAHLTWISLLPANSCTSAVFNSVYHLPLLTIQVCPCFSLANGSQTTISNLQLDWPLFMSSNTFDYYCFFPYAVMKSSIFLRFNITQGRVDFNTKLKKAELVETWQNRKDLK